MRLLNVFLATTILLFGHSSLSQATPGGIAGDYNLDGSVTHADYSLIADGWGSSYGEADLTGYKAEYGTTLPSTGPSPLVLSAASAFVAGNTEWVISFTGLSGGMAGHLTIGSTSPLVGLATAGPLFRDKDGSGAGVPGFLDGTVTTGILPTSSGVYASLGTNLMNAPISFSPFVPVEFVRFRTQGTLPSTITIRSGLSGNQQLSTIGYGGSDYNITTPLTFSNVVAVPEASSLAFVFVGALVSVASIAWKRRSK